MFTDPTKYKKTKCNFGSRYKIDESKIFDPTREEIQKAVAEYLASGGTITKIKDVHFDAEDIEKNSALDREADYYLREDYAQSLVISWGNNQNEE